MVSMYYPEMKEAKPVAEIEARLSHYGKHYFLTTRLTLTGRGVSLINTLTAEQLVPQAQHKVGMHEYKVTESAFAKISAEHSVSMELSL